MEMGLRIAFSAHPNESTNKGREVSVKHQCVWKNDEEDSDKNTITFKSVLSQMWNWIRAKWAYLLHLPT